MTRTVEEHQHIVRDLLPVLPAESVPLREALGLVLAQDLIAPIDLPPFDNSAMDGYVVRAADVAELPVRLPVSADIPAGTVHLEPLAARSAARIMTGAPTPDGAEVVVQVEFTDAGTDFVTIHRAPPPGVHFRRRGEDVRRGVTVLPAGTIFGPTQIGVAAALGFAVVPVIRRVRVLILSTGSELAVAGTDLAPGQIYESNAVMLAAAIEAIGGQASVLHSVTDDVDEFHAAIADATTDMDLLITSGGVSAGAFEVVKDALTGRGVDFVKVAMQPGMPQGAGTFNGTPVITLPGNPVSSFVSFEVFVRPALLTAMGHTETQRPGLTVPVSEAVDSPGGKRQYRRALLDTIAGTVKPWGGPGSHLLSWLAGADSMLVIPEDVTHLDVGDLVQVWLLG